MEVKEVPFSTIALGTWTFAGDSIWSESSEKESISVIHAALDFGIKLFDTSPHYGNSRSEAILGKAVKGRSDAAIATKIKINDKSPAELRTLIEKSLRRLNRETIDLMQIHWPGNSSEETLRALELFMTMKEEGKILNIGACNFGIYDLEETKDFPIISNQLPYNLMWRVIEKKIAPLSKDQGKTVWVYSPLQQGLLSGRYSNIEEFPKGRMRTRHFSSARAAANHGTSGMENETQSTLTAFLAVAADTNIPPLELGLRYIQSQPFIDTIIVGARSIMQLNELVISLKGTLNKEIIGLLNNVSDNLLSAADKNPDMYQSKSRIR